MATSASWKCHCNPICGPADAAQCLYGRTLDALSQGMPGDRIATNMLGALASLVAAQKTALGHALCRQYTEALHRGDAPAALDACRRLGEMAESPAGPGWNDAPGRI